MREIIRIKTPERMFSLGDSVLFETEEEHLNLAGTSYKDKKSQVVACSSQGLLAFEGSRSNAEDVYTNGNTGIESYKDTEDESERRERIMKNREKPELSFRGNLYSQTNGNTGIESLNRLVSHKDTERENERDETVVKNGEKTELNFQENSYSQTNSDTRMEGLNCWVSGKDIQKENERDETVVNGEKPELNFQENSYSQMNGNTGIEDLDRLVSHKDTEKENERYETVVKNGEKPELYLQGNSCSQTNGHNGIEDLDRLVSHKDTKKENERDDTVSKNGEKTKLIFQENSYSQTHCDSCGRPVKHDEFESELFITRKDLSSVQTQLETFKSRLEEELIERFKLEEELKSEAEAHESEMKILKEKIENLEENESEKGRRIEELESTVLVYKEEYEKGWEEMEDLRNFVGKYQTEVCKLRAEANTANDQAVEAINEMEILTKKTEKSEYEKDKIRKQLKSEMEGYWREVRELRIALENWEKLDAERKNRIQTLESEVGSYKDLVNKLREELTERSNKTDGEISKADPHKNSEKNEHLLVLCHELNEIFREHLNSQGKFSELSFVLAATQKELEEARNRSQIQNRTLQEFKQKYNDLHDNMVALSEENQHLRNSLEKKCADFRDIRRKFLVSETEVSWLKEALNIVDNAKKKSVCSNVMEAVG